MLAAEDNSPVDIDVHSPIVATPYDAPQWYDWSYAAKVHLHDPWMLADFASDCGFDYDEDYGNQYVPSDYVSNFDSKPGYSMMASRDVSSADTKLCEPLLPTWSSIKKTPSSLKSTDSTTPPIARPVQQFCRVCNDISSGKHFGVFSCEACKSFFRRSIRTTSSYVCRGSNCCEIDKSSRNKCQHCRLQKCLDIGMNKKGKKLFLPTVLS